MLVREKPSLRLNVLTQTPRGVSTRWGWDDPNPIYAPKDMSFGTVMPGGFERFTATLERDPQRSFVDTEELSTITAMGTGDAIAWQGRIEKLPDTGGFQAQETVEAVGWQAHLEDDNEAREIFVDQELSRWEGVGTQRKINFLNASEDEEDGALTNGPENLAALSTQLSGAWGRARASEMWYDAKGIPLSALKYVWQLQASGKIGDSVTTDPNWDWTAYLSVQETAVSVDSSGNLRASGPTGSGTVNASTNSKVWALVQLIYGIPAGTGGVEYPVFWPRLGVYGQHGLPQYGELSTKTVPGIHASDVAAYAISRWTPRIKYTLGAEGTINPSGFTIEQLAFLEPTTVAEMIKQATRFELEDWAVWEGPTFYMNERGARGRKWKARVGPASLQETGPQVSRLWNGVIVQYQDVTGHPRTVGPPEYTGAEPESADPALLDTDPENPLNRLGIKKWALLKMGTSTPAGAKAVGARFLEQSKLLESAGQATLNGYVEDQSGVSWPAWMVRGGDQISFVDAANPGYRRIVSTSYDDTNKTNTIQLDQPPDSMQALLERLSVVLVPLGLS